MKQFLIPQLVILSLSGQPAIGSAAAPEAPSCHPDETPAPGTTLPQVSPLVPRKPVMSAGPYVPPTDKNLQISEETTGKGEHRKIVLFRNILIDKLYPSMGGPWSRAYLPMDSTGPTYIWITRYRAEVLDSQTGKAAQEFMCHTKLDLFGGEQAPAPLKGVRSEFVISQGQIEAKFPKGYALRVENHPERKIDVNIMVLNNNAVVIHRNVDFKATIDYTDDASARHKKLIPLFETAASVSCVETQCETASLSSETTGADGQKTTGHWIVPPGRQEVRSPVGQLTPYDTTIHYMLMHLHPYAESMELRDLTVGKTVWKGFVKNDPKEARLLATDYYSDSRGLPVYKDHHYEIVAVYNNPTSHAIDAMASLWMYAKDEN